MYKLTALCILSMMLWTSSSAFAGSAAGKATIDGGVLQGGVQDGVVSYKGVPYAAPPIGKLRWEPPQAVAAWTGVRDATHLGHDCMQIPDPMEAAPPGHHHPQRRLSLPQCVGACKSRV